MFDRRILDQADFWVTREAVILQIREVHTEHLRNIVSYLLDRAVELHAAQVVDSLIDLVEADGRGAISGERLAWELTGRSVADLNAAAWLETTVLVRALRHELAVRERHALA